MKLFAHKTTNISSYDENPITKLDSEFHLYKINAAKGKISYISNKKDSLLFRISHAVLNVIYSLGVILAVFPLVKDPHCLKRLWKRVKTGREMQIVLVDQSIKNLFQETLMRVKKPFDLDFKYIFQHREMIFKDESNVSYFLDLITSSYSRYQRALFNHLSKKTDHDENIDALLKILNDFDQQKINFNISPQESCLLGYSLDKDEIDQVLHVIKTTNKTVQQFLNIKWKELPLDLFEKERCEDLMTLINCNQENKFNLAKNTLIWATGNTKYKSKRSQIINNFLNKNLIALQEFSAPLSLEEFVLFKAALVIVIEHFDRQQLLTNYVDTLKEKAGFSSSEISNIEKLLLDADFYIKSKDSAHLAHLIAYSQIRKDLTEEEKAQKSLKRDPIIELLNSSEFTTLEQYSQFWDAFKALLTN